MGVYSGGGSASDSDGTNQTSEAVDEDQQSLDDFESGGDDPTEAESDDGATAGGSESVAVGGIASIATPPADDEQPPSDDELDPCDEELSNDDDSPQDETEDEEQDDEQDETITVFHTVDPLSAMSWGVQPVIKRLKERYGDQIEIVYTPAPVRSVADSYATEEDWIQSTEEHPMPVDPTFWDNHGPDSTELVTKGFQAACQQGCGEEFIRELWINGIVAGENICDQSFLISVASEVGVDVSQFKDDLERVTVDHENSSKELPETFMEINGAPVLWSGYVYYSDFKIQFLFEGLAEMPLQELSSFVKEHGPVATPEVMEVYELTDREDAVQRLSELEQVQSVEFGGEQFWEYIK